MLEFKCLISRGIICLVGGGFGNSSEQLNKPENIAVDNKGRIYVTDTRNSRIQILGVVG
jgi:secreted PhoX family phosphatase